MIIKLSVHAHDDSDENPSEENSKDGDIKENDDSDGNLSVEKSENENLKEYDNAKEVEKFETFGYYEERGS